MDNFLKVKYNPTNKFYKNLYEFVQEEFKHDFKELDIEIRNKKHPKSLVDEFTEIGYVDYKLESGNKKIEYEITLIELKHLDIGNNILKLMTKRCKTYIESLGLEFCPKTATIMTLLHELGHVVYVEEFIRYTDEFSLAKLVAFDKTLDSIFELTFAPWEMSGFVSINTARTTFHASEVYSESYAYRNFPRFLKFLK